MLQNIRKNIQGTMAKIIVGLIVLTFALFGVESIIGGGGPQNAVEVNGEGITQLELQQQINQQKRRLMMSMGDELDPAMLEDQVLRGPTLEFMVQRELALQAADKLGLTVADTRLGQIVGDIPAFQVDGRFDPALYRRALGDQGFTPGTFQQRLREDLVMNQVRAGLVGSDFVTDAGVRSLAQLTEEQRDIRYLVVPLEAFADSDAIPDADVEQWYEANQERFRSQESVELDYVELRLEDLFEPVSEADLREQYQLERESFRRAEERAVSHILFEQGDMESDEALQARIASVQALLAEPGADFALLAREHSDDIGSASFGGELGYTSGDSFPAEIEEAVAQLGEGEVSAPVQSDAGIHLLKVTELRPARELAFEEVRMELEMRLQEERARTELARRSETLRDIVFNAEDLDGPASEVDLAVSRSGPVTRDQASGLFADQRLLTAAFSDEVLNQGYNSEVIEVRENHFVVLRVRTHNLPEIRPLDSVRDEVLAVLVDERSREAVRRHADDLLVRLRAGESIEALATELDYDWQVELGARRDNPGLPRELLARAFQLPAPDTDAGSFEYVQNADGDIEVLQLVRVIPADPEAVSMARSLNLKNRLLSESGRALDEQYQRDLRDNADVEIL